jgi:hypothetical protein
MLVGYDVFGSVFQDDSTSLINIKYTEFSAAILDEINFKKHANEKIDKKFYKVDVLETGTLDGLVSE